MVFEQLCKLRAFTQNDFCVEMFAKSKDKPYHIGAIAATNTSGSTKHGHNASLRWWDEHRRWVAQCIWYETERRVGTSVECGELSRRLHEAFGANAVFLSRWNRTKGWRFRSDATAKTKWLS